MIPEIVAFFLLLGIFFLLGIKGFAGGCLNEARSFAAGKGLSIERLESYYNERVPLKNALITLNGGFRRVLGQREVNERYRLENGQLTYVIPELDMTAIAENTVEQWNFRRNWLPTGSPWHISVRRSRWIRRTNSFRRL